MANVAKIVRILARPSLQKYTGSINPCAANCMTKFDGGFTQSTRSSTARPKEWIVPSNFDKKLLVKAKMYATLEDVPDKVSYAQVAKARDYGRVRGVAYMVAFGVLGSAVMVAYGRFLRSKGDTITKRGLTWQRDMREQGKREAAVKKAKDDGEA